MKKIGDKIHVTTEEARGGVTGHGVRYVLILSMGLAILVLFGAWVVGPIKY